MDQPRLRSVLRNINVLNLLLLAAAVSLALSLLSPLLGEGISVTVPKAKKAAEEPVAERPQSPPPSVMEFAVIAEHNVFNPDRRIPPEKKEEPPLPKPEFVLYGTLITADTSLAMIEDLKAPYTTASRGRRQRTLRLGAALSGFTLSEVYPERVVMARGEERVEVRLADRKRAGGASAAAPAPKQPLQRPAPAALRDKPAGTGLPPGVVQREAPPPGTPAPDEKAMKNVKEKFDALIRERLGRQPERQK